MKIIKLTQGYETIVDDEDYEELSKYKWFISKENKGYYAARKTYDSERRVTRETIKMHRQIMQTPKGMWTDHIDGNGLNNCKSNLRIVTSRQNSQNRHINKTSKYVGVSWLKAAKKWMAFIRINGAKKYLGYFENEIDAHNAYLKALSENGEVFVEHLEK
jgi:hypothetical protein